MKRLQRNKVGRKNIYPIRSCSVCSQKEKKASLLRFVIQDGNPFQDVEQNKSGRGAYCCKAGDCEELFVTKSNIWKRAFRL